MIPELLQNAYVQNRPKETWETPPLSKKFFDTWQQEGLIPAFQCVQELVRINGHDETAIRALGIIFGSAVLATGLTQYVETIRADITDNHYSLSQRTGLALYHASVGIIMAGQSPASGEEDRTYRVTRNYDGTIEVVHGEGGMTETEANEAIRRKLY